MTTDSSQPRLIVFTAPSGAGKTTIVKHLLNTFNELAFSVSATTRSKREHEIEGKDYYFLSQSEFLSRIESGKFAEWEEVYSGQYYGTLKSEISRLHQEGKSIVFDIDVQGAQSLKTVYGHNCLTVFVKPPSLEALLIRLKGRKTETADSLQRRIDKASLELTYESQFDTIILNDDLPRALAEAEQKVKQFLGF
jgi:guanylate kinase